MPAFLPAMSQPTSRGAAVTKPELPFPRSDSPRMARLRTPRRDPGRGGRRHQQPETLPMPNQLALLTTPSSLRVLYPRRRVTRRLAPRCVQSHKNRLAPALGLEIPRLTPADSPSWSCTVGDREDPPSTTPDHLPNPPDRSHDPRLRCWPRRWGCNVPPQGEARGVMCQVLSCTTPPTRNVGGLSPETEPCEPISRRWAGPQRGTSQPHGDVSHSGPSDPKSPLVLCPGLWW
jgi:hypothetical protein